MRVDLKRFRIEKAASKDETRPALNNVYLDAENGVMVATDGHSLAVVPVELAFDDATGLIPVEAVQIARKDQGKRDAAEIVANGAVSAVVRGKRAEFERPDGDFPDWRPLMKKRREEPVVTLALTPKLLSQLTDALGGGGVKLDIYGPNEGIRVTPLGIAGEMGAKGVLMPIRLGVAE